MAKLTITDPFDDNKVVMEANGTVMVFVIGGVMVFGYGLGKVIECVGRAVESLTY